MTRMDHDIQDAAKKQLDDALLMFNKEHYYSAITLAGAAEEILGEFRLKLLRTGLRQVFEREEFKDGFPSEGMSSQSRSLRAVSDKLLKVWDEGPAKLLESEEDPYEFLLESEEGPAKSRNKLLNKLRKSADKEKKLLTRLENIVEENLKELEDSGNETDPCKLLLDCLQETITWNKPSLDSLADAAAQLSCGVAGKNDSKKNILWIAQWVRNLLKHGFPGQPKFVKFDAQEIATDTLQRAISNYLGLTGELTPAMTKFF